MIGPPEGLRVVCTFADGHRRSYSVSPVHGEVVAVEITVRRRIADPAPREAVAVELDQGKVVARSIVRAARKRLPTFDRPPLTEAMIVEAIRAWTATHGHPPARKSGDATAYFPHGKPETWNTVHQALRFGLRGLPGGTTLSALRDQSGFFTPTWRSHPLTEELIRSAAARHHARTGRWPSSKSGDATEDLGLPATWMDVENALKKGLRGLPGQSSLSKLLRPLKEEAKARQAIAPAEVAHG